MDRAAATWCMMALGLVAGVAVAGCSRTPASSRPQTVPVKGKITLAGQPLAKATVSFQPDGTGNGATGITDDGGNYVLSTFAAKDGAVPGKYKITVTKFEEATSGSSVDVNDPGYAPPTEGATAAKPKSIVPEQYSDPAKSGLTAEVATGAANSFDFDIK